MSSTSTSRRRRTDGHAPDRLAGGMDRRAGEAAREGEGAHAGRRRAGRRASPDAVDGGGEGVHVRWPGWPGQPARPVRRPPPAGRLPRLLRAGRHHLPGVGRRVPGAGLRRLLLCGRPGRAPRPPERAGHDARVRLTGPAGRDPGPEGADGLGADPLVLDHRRLRRRLRRGRVARPQRLHPRRRQDLPHLFHRRPRRRGHGHDLELPRHHRARAARRSGRTRRRATRRARPTGGGTTTTPTPGRRDRPRRRRFRWRRSCRSWPERAPGSW